nr:hypothetical protein [Tanacetum cinerariifolium]
MSSNNVSSAVTYTSLSFDSNGPSWGIPLMDVDELPEMDPYEEVAQWQAPPLSPAYVPDPIELDEHVTVYVSEPEHLEYHVSSDDDMQDDDEDPEEDPEEDHTDYPADEGDCDDEPSDDDDDDDDTNDEDEEPTENEDDDKEDEKHLALADSSTIHVVGLFPSARIQRHLRLMSLHIHLDHLRIGSLFLKHVSIGHGRLSDLTHLCQHPWRHALQSMLPHHHHLDTMERGYIPAYDHAPLGHRTAMIRMRDDIPEEDMPPRRRFVLTAPQHGCDVAESSLSPFGMNLIHTVMDDS